MAVDQTFYKGIDVAKWEPVIDWAKVKAAGFFYAFVKATQGINVDPYFAEHWRNSKGVMPRGPYHFWDPQYLHVTPEVQAEKFWDTIAHDPGELPAVVDLEAYTSGPWVGSQNWYRFLERFRILSGGKEILIYTAPSFFNAQVVRLPKVIDINYFKQFPLWISDPDPQTEPDLPTLYKEWLFRQYSYVEIIPGITDQLGRPTRCDANVFHGTQEEFDHRFQLIPNPNPDPTPEPPMPTDTTIRRTARVKLDVTLGLKIRLTAGGEESGLKLSAGTIVNGIGNIIPAGSPLHHWTEILGGPLPGGFVAMEYLDNIVEINPPLPVPVTEPIKADIILHDVKVVGDQYEARAIELKKVK